MDDLPISAPVECTDGPCGKSMCVIFNPVNHSLTHVVIEGDELPGAKTRILPVANVASVEQGVIKLNRTRDEVFDMAPFLVEYFVQQSASGGAFRHDAVFHSNYTIDDTAWDSYVAQEVPAGEMALYSGMEVEAADGKVGKLDELVLDSNSGEVKSLRMRRGHLWGEREITIPVGNIDLIDTRTVYLKIDKAAVEALPAEKVGR
jgi:sporulation protein YlmC with PRC-barrel domain